MDNSKKPTPAYVAFKTFFNAIESLAAHGIPNQIDRSVWPSFSGVTQSQVLSAFRFLGLIDEHGVGTADLVLLVESKESRKETLRALLQQGYPELFKIGLDKASPRQFEEALRQYDLIGGTQRKARAFFLQAAQFADVPLSPFLKGRTRTVSATAPRRRKTKELGASDQMHLEDSAVIQTGSVKSVAIKSGGTLRIYVDANVFAMPPEDRDFIFGLIDTVQEYERRNPAAHKSAAGGTT